MTVDSLFENQQQNLFLLINEDSDDVFIDRRAMVMNSPSIGQHKAIESVLSHFKDKYYLHVEDDWRFDNSYDWIAESVKIMEADPTIIKVLCRNGSPHPCTHDRVSESGIAYGILEPWENDGITWSGFSWNPGVTHLDLLKQFIPFGKHEQDLAEAIHQAGYKIAELSTPIYTHIGHGRSTHE
jgi:hypothetical protein